MPNVVLMPDVAAEIAAGEVIGRPASVVKAQLDEVAALDVDAQAPLEALTKLCELRERARTAAGSVYSTP